MFMFPIKVKVNRVYRGQKVNLGYFNLGTLCICVVICTFDVGQQKAQSNLFLC